MAFPWENDELNNFVEVIFFVVQKWFSVIETNISSIYISDESDDLKQSKAKKAERKCRKTNYHDEKHIWKKSIREKFKN